ncbi:nucleotidyl transferase AbiEii/AbiGii toxin family protein [Plebeiibacterium sediminum]|uniref:Nucleotidyl transferase AbiEii/AbiGii toxin family protein n=1 Tax=Plebeiibacterium sediminum TaxID=2992112 RepID=A0AAE3SGB6_9BACT|nr:nucleotidyl transferase AbiEii/AbiGii toxin family protein [Plebeiobacterium sediminum]MCW3788161.1 nucleotidyl transferase AbiEii/AbiGii toxin family protein [Plebeiobacterium sediminum]
MLHFETIIPETRFILEDLMRREELKDYRLVGGTALSLYKGHRVSDDIDLFLNPEKEFDKQKIKRVLISLADRPEDIEISDMTFGFSSYLTYNVRGDELKIDLMHFESDPFIDEPNIINDIRLASTRDISAMKLNAITSRSEKKDFIDIHELLLEYSIKDMLEHYKKKYPYNDPKDVIFAFAAIDNADSSYMPKMFIDWSWDQIKENLKQQFRKYLDQEAGV